MAKKLTQRNGDQALLKAWVERGQEALGLRARGKSYQEIGEALGITASGAYKIVQNALKRTQHEAADEVRAMELTRLDELLDGVWEKAKRGDSRAVVAALAIMDRRAKYMGLDKPEAPDKIEVVFTNDWRKRSPNESQPEDNSHAPERPPEIGDGGEEIVDGEVEDHGPESPEDGWIRSSGTEGWSMGPEF